MTVDLEAPKVKRKPLNVGVREDLIEAVRRTREAAWKDENRATIDAHNTRAVAQA
jgi:hypothetical protein